MQSTAEPLQSFQQIERASNKCTLQMEQKYLLGNYSADGVRMTAGMVIERGTCIRVVTLLKCSSGFCGQVGYGQSLTRMCYCRQGV